MPEPTPPVRAELVEALSPSCEPFDKLRANGQSASFDKLRANGQSAGGRSPLRDPAAMLEQTLTQWGERDDLWIFGYGSLIWKPEFEFVERRPAKVHGWHRALRMWSRINRGTPERPGLVFGMLSGGSCQGMVFRIPRAAGQSVLARLWAREMTLAVYDPKWLKCHTSHGPVEALAFTLSRKSPSHTGVLTPDEYKRIFTEASGIYGTTHEYAHRTLEELRRHNIRDKGLERLLKLIESPKSR